jgi:hypothetical protein
VAHGARWITLAFAVVGLGAGLKRGLFDHSAVAVRVARPTE